MICILLASLSLAAPLFSRFGYDHLILKIEWAKPSAPKDAGSEPVQFRSGYGKALAQDTTEKVSYASNLTTNR
jgi:translation initiation factor 3 subunit G